MAVDLAVADREDAPADRVPLQRDPARDIGGKRDPGRDREAEEIALPDLGEAAVVGNRHRLVAGKKQAGSVGRKHGRQRGDERLDAQPRDDHAVDDADVQARSQRRRAVRPPNDTGESSAATTLAMAAVPPTERSMPPVMITSAMPSAISANMEL